MDRRKRLAPDTRIRDQRAGLVPTEHFPNNINGKRFPCSLDVCSLGFTGVREAPRRPGFALGGCAGVVLPPWRRRPASERPQRHQGMAQAVAPRCLQATLSYNTRRSFRASSL
jgi:hypothetical protein